MEFFPKLTTIDFMEKRNKAFLFSGCIFIFSISMLCLYGLNLGLDFTGGTQIVVHFAQAKDIDQVREALEKHRFEKFSVQSYGSTHDVLIRVSPSAHLPASAHPHTVDKGTELMPNATSASQALRNQVHLALPEGEIQRVAFIGPQVGHTLMTHGMLAMLVSLIATMLYISARFEMRFAISAAISLIHDPILILGVFALFHLEFNLISLAALLTILGYSLNDTIVVYDRARENFLRLKNASTTHILNLSINQTLSRTIMTSGLTLLVVIALLLFGGETLRGFSVALVVGIVIGTYSSIYVAGALSLVLGLKRERLLPRNVTQKTDKLDSRRTYHY